MIAGPLLAPLLVGRSFLLLLACGALIYYVVAVLATLRFFLRERQRTLGEFTPPVSVLKPVHGVDFASYENFSSFCQQNYPQYEILFCVNDVDDPAVGLIERLRTEHPQKNIRLLHGAEQLGTNRKVNNLVLLAQEARYELLVQSDGDVRVDPNYLRQVTSLFADPQTAVVSCFYRGMTESNLWAEIEALGAATDFAASVAVADWTEGITFALGASVATSKTWLQKIGGYAALANVLADDYEIGNRMARAGGRVLLSPEVVTTMYPAQSFAGYWSHQQRWARTVRLCRPWSYLGLVLTHGLPWTVLGAVVSGSTVAAVGFLSAYLITRLSLAWTIGVWGLQDATTRGKWWLIPFRDALHFAVWLGGFASNRILWGEAEFRLMAGGEMVKAGSSPPAKK